MLSAHRDPRPYAIIGAAMEVHSHMGNGFLEAVYQEARSIEMQQRNIPFKREVHFPVFYKGLELNTHYRADFICYDTVVVELKALPKLTGVEESQLINYLKGTRLAVGLLLNFGASSLEFKRYVN
jgi:GxxExxY protein